MMETVNGGKRAMEWMPSNASSIFRLIRSIAIFPHLRSNDEYPLRRRNIFYRLPPEGIVLKRHNYALSELSHLEVTAEGSPMLLPISWLLPFWLIWEPLSSRLSLRLLSSRPALPLSSRLSLLLFSSQLALPPSSRLSLLLLSSVKASCVQIAFID